MPSSRLYKVCRKTIDTLTDNITHQPGGYLWWTTLPKKGRHSSVTLTRNWTKLLYTTLFPPLLQRAMLSACLSVDGTPNTQGHLLYTWLLINVYNNNEVMLYKDWLQLSRTLQYQLPKQSRTM
jgi:hypothetical protein